MSKLFVLASLAAAAAAQSIDYSGCGSADCTTSPGFGCSVYVSNLPLTNVCTQGGPAASIYYFKAIAGSVASTATVTTYNDAACNNLVNTNTNMALTGVTGCQTTACVCVRPARERSSVQLSTPFSPSARAGGALRTPLPAVPHLARSPRLSAQRRCCSPSSSLQPLRIERRCVIADSSAARAVNCCGRKLPHVSTSV
jgi:hypothetical protein